MKNYLEDGSTSSDGLIYTADGVGIMHKSQIDSGQYELYKSFGITFDHHRDRDAFYKRVKEDLVAGFTGEPNNDSNLDIIMILLFFITNYAFYQVLVSFLCIHVQEFK